MLIKLILVNLIFDLFDDLFKFRSTFRSLHFSKNSKKWKIASSSIWLQFNSPQYCWYPNRNPGFWEATKTYQTNVYILIRLTFEQYFSAVETLQQLKTTFTPYEKLDVLLETFKEINQIGQDTCGSSHCWSMDDLFPVFQYVVVRARILQLGAEIHMIDDLMESHLSTGEYGIMFTTLQASYYQIIRESISMY